jgi:hypothetical protein
MAATNVNKTIAVQLPSVPPKRKTTGDAGAVKAEAKEGALP